MSQEITKEDLLRYQTAFAAQPKAAARQRSIVANGLLEATEDTFAYQQTRRRQPFLSI